jgi:CDP-glycerol glycerophosphotransferase (TagB/SpsB family)
VERWDLLLSPNPPSTPRLRQAFSYDGEVLESGYPRNDALTAPDREVVRARVRQELGIADDKTVVLYAPTWRDDREEMVDYLDLVNFADELPNDHVLLVRGHSRTLAFGQDLQAERLVDVTSYPDVADLMLIADVLVTDYSSVMFDFAGTGKPIVFFTPDLAHYSTDLRGFYFDLLAEAPGAVVHEREGLRDAILATRAESGGRGAAARARADAWRERFTPLDDGHAGARVVQRMLDAGWFDPLG